VRLYGPRAGRPPRAASASVRAHVGPVRGLALAAPPDDNAADACVMMTWTDGGAGKLWSVSRARGFAPEPRPAFAASLARGHNGTWVRAGHAAWGAGAGGPALATGGADGRLVWWDAGAGASALRAAAAHELATRDAPVSVIALRPDGVAAAAAGSGLWVADPRARAPTRLPDPPAPVSRLAWHADGRRLVATTVDGDILWMDAGAGSVLVALPREHGSGAAALALAGDQTATGGGDRRVCLWLGVPEVQDELEPEEDGCACSGDCAGPSTSAPAPPDLCPYALPDSLDASLDRLEGALGALASAVGALDARAAAAEAAASLARRARAVMGAAPAMMTSSPSGSW